MYNRRPNGGLLLELAPHNASMDGPELLPPTSCNISML